MDIMYIICYHSTECDNIMNACNSL